jgi:PAS domain-containing protein
MVRTDADGSPYLAGSAVTGPGAERAPSLKPRRFSRQSGRVSKGHRMSSYTMSFEKLLEAAPDALVGMDQKGVIRFFNRQTESLFGYERDQLIGEPIDTLVPEPLWQIYAEHQQDYFSDPITRSSGLDLQLSGRDKVSKCRARGRGGP